MTTDSQPPTLDTVEAVVRHQLSVALGGRRGMFETAVPGLMFTITYLTTKNVQAALYLSVAAGALLLLLRLVQRSSVQFVVNAFVGIAIGWIFVTIAASKGGSADEQALAYFLPGIIYSAVYSTVGAFTCLIGWPLFGFVIGSVTGDPTAWHKDRQIVRLCSRLTWVLLLPGVVGVLVQGPVWFLGWSDTLATGTAVAVLAGLRLGLGWPLRIGSWSAMLWLLTRDATPITQPEQHQPDPTPQPEGNPEPSEAS